MITTKKLIYNGTIRAKKNSKQIIRAGDGRPLIVSNSAAKANEDDMVKQFKLQGVRPMSAPERAEAMLEAGKRGIYYHIKATIYQPNGIRRDLDNQITSILDALTKSGAILDDCRKFVKALMVIDGGIDKNNPRAEITIITREPGDE
jgi:Holliday junction resolvase RusA-like endonuclease